MESIEHSLAIDFLLLYSQLHTPKSALTQDPGYRVKEPYRQYNFHMRSVFLAMHQRTL